MNKKLTPQKQNEFKTKSLKISIISSKINPLKVNKKKNENVLKKTKTEKENEMKKGNEKELLKFMKLGLNKRNKEDNHKLSNSLNSQKILPLQGNMINSISIKKSINVNSPKLKQLNSLREKIISSEEKKKGINNNCSISNLNKISKINSSQKIKVNKSKNNISLRKINSKNNENNNNKIYNNNIGSSININKTTNYSSFDTIEKNKNMIKPSNVEIQCKNIGSEYDDKESNFLNIELGNTKSFSTLPDYSLNFSHYPQNSKIDEKEIDLEEFFSNPFKKKNFKDCNNPERSLYYIDTSEMKDGEDIQKVYSITMYNNEFRNGLNFERKINNYNNKNKVKGENKNLIYNIFEEKIRQKLNINNNIYYNIHYNSCNYNINGRNIKEKK